MPPASESTGGGSRLARVLIQRLLSHALLLSGEAEGGVSPLYHSILGVTPRISRLILPPSDYSIGQSNQCPYRHRRLGRRVRQHLRYHRQSDPRWTHITGLVLILAYYWRYVQRNVDNQIDGGHESSVKGRRDICRAVSRQLAIYRAFADSARPNTASRVTIDCSLFISICRPASSSDYVGAAKHSVSTVTFL